MQTERPPHVLGVPRWTIVIHAVQIALAIIILGLNSYGIHYYAYNNLVYSLVACLCTLLVAGYLLVSQLFVHKIYNFWVALAVHIWMVIFWLAQFSAVARVAALWSGTSCGYYYYSGYCWYKRDLGGLAKRDTTTYGAYFGALVAGSVFGAFEFILWVVCMIVLIIHIQRHQNAGRSSAPPPMYTGTAMGDQPVPMEKYNAQVPAQSQYQGTPQSPYAQPVQPQPPQQAYHQGTGPQFAPPYNQQQDPVDRVSSISPVTVGGQPTYPSPNTVELATPQHTGNYNQNPHAAELNTTPSHPTNAAELGNDYQRHG